MEKHFSYYLDATRFLAAFLVVLNHFLQYGMVAHRFERWVPELGRMAVIFFFLLSGYVIAYTSSAKHQTLKEYAVARLARIYSVAFPVLLLAFVVVAIGHLLTPSSPLNYQLKKAYLYLPFHMLFLGELWNFSETPPWLIPYWSLSYEVWYYVFFGILYFSRGVKRIVLGVLCLAVMGHKLWLLMPVWWAGVLFFRCQDKLVLNKNFARIAWGASILVFCGYKYLGIDEVLRGAGNEVWPFAQLKLGSADRYLSDYAVGIIFLGNFYFAKNAQFRILERFSNFIKATASYTFTLYLVHAVVLFSFKEWYRYNAENPVDFMWLTISVALATYLLGSLTERKKSAIAHWFGRLLDRLATNQSGAVMVKKMRP